MKKNPIGGLLVVLAVCILALCCGIVGGTQHIGQDVSKQILSTSLTSSPDTVSKIDESSFNATKINTQSYTTTTKVSTTPTKTYTKKIIRPIRVLLKRTVLAVAVVLKRNSPVPLQKIKKLRAILKTLKKELNYNPLIF